MSALSCSDAPAGRASRASLLTRLQASGCELWKLRRSARARGTATDLSMVATRYLPVSRQQSMMCEPDADQRFRARSASNGPAIASVPSSGSSREAHRCNQRCEQVSGSPAIRRATHPPVCRRARVSKVLRTQLRGPTHHWRASASRIAARRNFARTEDDLARRGDHGGHGALGEKTRENGARDGWKSRRGRRHSAP